MIINSTTPKIISNDIKAFCADIDSAQASLYVPVRPAPEAEINSCFGSVVDHANRHGGSIQYGWIIWEEPSQLVLEAEFHAVWVLPSGDLVDITPKADGELNILFLPDTNLVYTGQLVENRRKLLVISDLTLRWLWLGHKKHLFKERYFRNGQVDMVAALKDKDQWDQVESNAEVITFGRNSYCPCGSGKRLRLCCGRHSPS